MAFAHTTFGRLNTERDDVDLTLPWEDLIPPSLMASKSSGAPAESTEFGRTNSLGMKIYRRLNIVLEEVSDVSRILLPTFANAKAAAITASSSSDNTTEISALLRKYDIVSLQPMNEPALQNICELLNPAVTISSEESSPQSPQIDMIVLEYATGSRGGYGLPFRTRKDYVIKALEAGVTFELWYVLVLALLHVILLSFIAFDFHNVISPPNYTEIATGQPCSTPNEDRVSSDRSSISSPRIAAYRRRDASL